MRGLKKIAGGGDKHTDTRTSRLLERMGLRADSLKRALREDNRLSTGLTMSDSDILVPKEA